MAEAERRPGKTPLRKQPEIEEVEEENLSQGKDVCMTKMIDTNRISSDNGEEDHSASEHVACSAPAIAATNGGGMGGSPEGCEVAPSSLQSMPMPPTDLPSSSPETTRKDRPLKVNHSFSKAKPLMRGTAIDDSIVPTPEVKVITTPAPDNDDSPYEFTAHMPVPLLGQDGSMGRSVLQKNGSLSSDAGTSNCSLSRESSVEKIYKDSSGVDLEEFIKKTLLKSKKDKQMLLSLEKDFKMFVESPDQHYQLAEMCSYDRMICHRVAAFYGMDHNIDKSGKSVIVSKTKFTRIPTFSCEDYIRAVEPDDAGSEKKMRLLKKPASMEERSRAGDKAQFSSHRTKSLEERQRHYDEKRKIIFGASSEEAQGLPVIDHVPASTKRLSSRDWSSTDSSGYVSEDGSRLRRNMMAKSNSYGDSITSGSYESAPVRTKQASPENSQSPISGSGRSSADVNSPSQGHMGCGGTGPPYTVLVATDINTIPPGSMVVNPHTLQPHTNADGTPYRYNPSDPNSFPPWLSGGGASVVNSTSQQQPISFSHHTAAQPVQYTHNNDLLNQFSAMEVTPSMEVSLDSQQMMSLGHQPQQVPQQVPQQMPQAHLQRQQHGQVPIMVSAAMQPAAQQFMPSFPTAGAAAAAAAAQNQGFYTGTQVQFVPVDAQGMPLTGPTGGSLQSAGMVSYGQPHVIQTASALPPAMLDQSTIPAGGGLYGQGVYPGSVTDPGGATPNYCVPYMANSLVYPGAHYPGNGGMTLTPTPSHYNPYVAATAGAPQQQQQQQQQPSSSSPQLQFAPLQTAQVRPATPPTLAIGQPVGYHGQTAALGHGVASPPQLQPGTYYAATQPHHPFSAQGQPMGQVMQVSVRPQGGGGGGGGGGGMIPVSTAHPHPHHHPATPGLQHSQSYPLLRTIPSSSGPTPLALGPAPPPPPPPNPAPTPPHQHHHHHPMMSVKSVSMGSIRGGGGGGGGGGAATPDKETAAVAGMGLGGCGGSYLPGVNQAPAGPPTPLQFPGQLVAQGVRQPQPGDLRVMGAASIRPQMTPSLIAIQPGQPVRSNRSSGMRQSRPPKHTHSTAGSNSNPPPTTASASVARVMSLDSGSAVHQPLNRP